MAHNKNTEGLSGRGMLKLGSSYIHCTARHSTWPANVLIIHQRYVGGSGMFATTVCR